MNRYILIQEYINTATKVLRNSVVHLESITELLSICQFCNSPIIIPVPAMAAQKDTRIETEPICQQKKKKKPLKPFFLEGHRTFYKFPPRYISPALLSETHKRANRVLCLITYRLCGNNLHTEPMADLTWFSVYNLTAFTCLSDKVF